MRDELLYLAVVLTLAVSGCSDGGGVLGHPKISVEQIGTDIVGKNTGEGLLSWTFAKNEPREIEILETDYSGDKGTVVIHMKTEGFILVGFTNKVEGMAGKLRLHYEWVADEWTLVRVENLDFKSE